MVIPPRRRNTPALALESGGFGRKKRSAFASIGGQFEGEEGGRLMTRIQFHAMPTELARRYQAGGADAYGRAPERRVADGSRVPCRHCLEDVAGGEGYLILAYRPFSELQPYAETGPIFLHAGPCERRPDAGETPPMLLRSQQMIVRGYGRDERIIYGTGQVVPTDRIAETAAWLLDRSDVAFIHVRSATNNCFQCRIDRP
jgi:hypothetical protein